MAEQFEIAFSGFMFMPQISHRFVLRVRITVIRSAHAQTVQLPECPAYLRLMLVWRTVPPSQSSHQIV